MKFWGTKIPWIISILTFVPLLVGVVLIIASIVAPVSMIFTEAHQNPHMDFLTISKGATSLGEILFFLGLISILGSVILVPFGIVIAVLNFLAVRRKPKPEDKLLLDETARNHFRFDVRATIPGTKIKMYYVPLSKITIYYRGKKAGEFKVKKGFKLLGVPSNYTLDIFGRAYTIGRIVDHGDFKLNEVLNQDGELIGYYGWNKKEFEEAAKKHLLIRPLSIAYKHLKSINRIRPVYPLGYYCSYYIFDKEKNMKGIVKAPNKMVLSVNYSIKGIYKYNIVGENGASKGVFLFANPPVMRIDDLNKESDDWIPFLLVALQHQMRFYTKK
ncbi:MAG: hypothetical protein J7L23_01575 [Candidatus Diapherotrites archaeon]|nr:hypothetical protein [Candidatus Diapherotrites archaeon]